MSNNSSAWSTGQGELKRGHLPGCAGSGAVAQGAAGHPLCCSGNGHWREVEPKETFVI